MGGNSRNQRADFQAAGYHEITADRVKEERSELLDEIVEELDEEFFAVDLVAHHKNFTEAVREIGQFQLGCIVGVNFVDALDGFADAVGQPADQLDPLLAQQVHFALQPGNDVELDGIEGDGRQRHHPILHHQKTQNDQQGAALEGRQRKSFADKPAQGLHFRRHHGDNFALGHVAEGRQRKAQNPAEEVETQPAQHALAGQAAVNVDVIFEALVDDDQNQEADAQGEQKRHMVKFNAEIFLWEIARIALNRLINDELRQFVKCVQERKRKNGQDRQPDLLPFAVLQYVFIYRRFHCHSA